MTLFAAGILMVGISQAQERGGRQNRTPEEMAKMQVERLTEQLALNKTQQDSIYKYTLELSKSQREIMQSAGDNREGAMNKMRDLREAGDKMIKNFLTEEQAKKYETLAKERQQRRNRQ